jgi:membrane fusion protein, multidrug efflux system
MRRLVLLVLFFALVGGAAYYVQLRSQEGMPPARPADAPAPVLAATVMQKPMPVQIDTVGRVQAIATVAVRSRVDGVIRRVAVEDGQVVKAGDLLFELDDQEAQAELQTAAANLARDRAQLEIAKRDEERLQPLAAKDFASRQQLDQLRTNVTAAEATLAADQAQLEAAKIRLAYTVIRAPIDGRIGTIASKVGSSIRPNDTTALMTINQLQPIYVAFAVPQRYLGDLQDAMAVGELPVTATIPGREAEPQAGMVSFIENEVDPTTNTLSVKASFANGHDRLWPGQYVNVVVTLRVDPDAIVVPAEAVQMGQQGPYVFVIRSDDTVEMRPVEVARAAGQETVIAQGLSAGERIVTEGQLRLEPGVKVDVTQPEISSADPAAAP